MSLPAKRPLLLLVTLVACEPQHFFPEPSTPSGATAQESTVSYELREPPVEPTQPIFLCCACWGACKQE